MKTKLIMLLGVIMVVFSTILHSSCSNEVPNQVQSNYAEIENVLLEYGNFHNAGLDFIKSELIKSNDISSDDCLVAAFNDFVVSQYGEIEAARAFDEIEPVKDVILNPSVLLVHARSNGEAESMVNPLTQKALDECIVKISECLNKTSEDNLFDNDRLLKEIHSVITQVYIDYTENDASVADAQAVAQTLGVLYGSIAYWTNSCNVEFWTNVDNEKTADVLSPLSRGNSGDNKDKKKEDDKKKDDKQQKDDKILSKSDYIMTVAAADAIGSMLCGSGAVLASGAAALYFDVE